MKTRFLKINALGLTLAVSGLVAPPLEAKMHMENLDRGVVALRTGSNQVYVGWRFLGLDPDGTAFHLYRSIGNGAAVQLTSTPLTATTDYRDAPGTTAFSSAITYFVRPVVNGTLGSPSRGYTLQANAPVQSYLSIPLEPPPGGTTPSGEAYTYSANDASCADLDGDGQLDFVLKWDPSNSKDNSQSGYTGEVYLDGIKPDGTRLWRLNLGRNIRAGAHYTQFIAYDLDSDGRAEVAMKTAPGTIDGAGNPVLMAGDNAAADYQNSGGYILSGPEYLTVFDGRTGAALATTAYQPGRGTVSDWGDSYGNRVDRFLAGVAYLDGSRPSLLMCRGYYTQTHVVAWDWREGKLTRRWRFDAANGTAYAGQGNHQLSVADVDADGKQEIVYGSMTVDDNGTGLYSTGLGHGDALHVSDFDPTRPGLEVFAIHEDMGSSGNRGATFRDAATGAILWSTAATDDTGRGVILDIDPARPGAEAWASNQANIYAASGEIAGPKPSNTHQNFAVWWDADLLRETLDGTVISDINPTTYGRTNILEAWRSGATDNNSTKANPCLSGDLVGDWREEVVWRNGDSTALMLFTPVSLSTTRLRTFLHDPQYRLSLAWQNVGYNQPPHTSFFVGSGMATPPMPDITTDPFVPRGPSNLVWTGAASGEWNAATANFRLSGGTEAATFADGDQVRFDDTSALGALTVGGTLSPASITADHAAALTLGGDGVIAGSGGWVKRGSGTLTVQSAHTFTGGTILEAGTLALGNAAALGSGAITLRGGTLATGALTPANAIAVENDATISGGNSGGSHGIKAVSGTGNLTLAATSIFDLEGSLAGFSGKLLFGGSGSFRLFGTAGSATADFDLGSRGLNARSGSAFALGSLAGQSGASLSGASGSGNNVAVTYTIGGANRDSVFNGVISNGNAATAIIKTGTGRLVLGGANTYTGATQVQSGTLVVNGSLAATAFAVSSGAKLGGSGTLGGNLALAADSGLIVEASHGLSVAGNLTLSGPVTVSDTPAAPLPAGTYRLLEYAGALTGAPQFGWSSSSASALTATFAYSAGRIEMTLATPPSGFSTWSATRYPGIANPAVSGPLADPDGNGVANLMEYALGLAAGSPSSQLVLPALVPSGDRFALTFTRVADPGLTYSVEAGDAPTTLGSIWTSSGVQNTAGPVTVPDTVPSAGHPKRFMRLQVSGGN